MIMGGDKEDEYEEIFANVKWSRGMKGKI